jgi:tetratricopeptide (TPR) repeat protein
MKRTLLLCLLSALIPSCLYLFCLSPGVSWEDSGEFITTAARLGIAHPPGHPLYIVLARLFCIHTSPLSTARSVNLFSVLSAFFALFAFPAILLSLFTSRSSRNTTCLPSLFFITIFFAFSRTFWSVAEIAEVYSLHTLLVLCLFASLLTTRKGGAGILLFSYTLGLSLTNNITVAYLIPAFACFLILERKHMKKRYLFPALLLFILGISLYLYVPIRARFHPVFNWGDASTLKNFIHLLTAQEFSKGFLNMSYTETGLPSTFINLLREISFWGIIPFGYGIVLLWRKERNIAVLFAAAILCNIVLSFFTGRGPDFYAYFLPSIAITFLIIGYGIVQLISRMGSKSWAALPLLLLLSLSPLILNYHSNCRRHDLDARNYGAALLSWLPEGGILLTENTNDYFILTYLNEIEKSTDAAIFYAPLFKETWYRERLSSMGFHWQDPLTPLSFARENHKVFYTPGAGISLPAANLTPYGPLFRIVTDEEPLEENLFVLPHPVHQQGEKRYAYLFSRFGEFYFKRKHYPYAIAAFEQAREYDPRNPALYHNLALLYRKTGNLKKARQFEEAAKKHGFRE